MKNLTTLFLSALVVSTLAACSGENKIITGADLSASIDSEQVHIDFTTHLDTKNILLPILQIPILNPDNTFEQLGQLNIFSPAPAFTDINLKLNLTHSLSVGSLNHEVGLPNGTAFPVLTVKPENWYSLSLNESQASKLYLNYDPATKAVVLGYTLATDSVSAGLVANLFSVFSGTYVNGVGGVYSSPVASQSGIAVFADITKVLPFGTRQLIQQKVAFADKTSARRREVIEKKMIELNTKKAKLKFK